MSVQDDARERQMVSLFNLTVPKDRSRSGVDAHLTVDGHQIDFELKSTTKNTVSTVRDLGRDHIAKWRNQLHWIFAFYEIDGQTLRHCIYASPADMEPWISEKEKYIRPDLVLASRLPAKVTEDLTMEMLGKKSVYSFEDAKLVMKRQWTSDQYLEFSDAKGGYSLGRMTEIVQLRTEYVIERGATLNNPHIEKRFFDPFERITDEHSAKLRAKIRAYLSNNAPATECATR